LAWFVAYMIGYPEISNFDSSWFEWSMGPEKNLNPVIDEYPNLP
jgi:thiosulfate/3-mercaptopyruvate sulfurtransferase